MLKSVVKVLDAKPVGPELSSWLCCRHFLVIFMGLEKATQHGKESEISMHPSILSVNCVLSVELSWRRKRSIIRNR